MIKWHRLFGLGLMDYFQDTAYDVEVEKDLSIKQQFLDVVVIEKRRAQRVREIQEPCDGLEGLRRFNLLTFKSLHEPLNLWAMEELIGHYVNFRKLMGLKNVSPNEIQLYAVCARRPKGLAKQMSLRPVRKGVYDGEILSRLVRVIVLSQVHKAKRNALWALFSGHRERVAWGARRYVWHRDDWSKILSHLYHGYQYEGLNMSYTIEDFHKEVLADCLANCSVEERLAGLRPEEVLRQYKPEEVLRQYKPEERLAGLNIKERLEGLSQQEITLEGRMEEASAMLLRLLKHRFRDVPAWAYEKMAQADLPTLEVWMLRILDVRSLEALFMPMENSESP